MNKKSKYQYFNNISQRINLTEEIKSLSNENLRKASTDTSNSWFSSLKSNKKSRSINRLNRRQNSWTTSSSASSLISTNNSLASNSKNDTNFDVNSEKADTNLSKFDIRTSEQLNNKLNNSPVALRKLTTNRNVQAKDEFNRKRSKDDESDCKYSRYSSIEPDDLVPNQIVIQQYLNFLRQNNLELNINNLNISNQLNHLNQLYQFNVLNHHNHQKNSTQLRSTEFQQSSIPLADQSNLSIEQNFPKATSHLIECSKEDRTTINCINSLNEKSTTLNSLNSVEQLNNLNKPQLVRCPQLAIETNCAHTTNSSENSEKKLNENRIEFNEQLNEINEKHETNLIKQTASKSVNQLDAICDQVNEKLNLNLNSNLKNEKSESNSIKKSTINKFELVKELFDPNAHLYMSIEQMTAMEQLIKDNPRTCNILLNNRKEELGFNLITKKKPHLAHLVKKVNPNLKSAQAGLQENDQLLAVNGIDCRELTHQQVVKLLEERDNRIKLVVCQPHVYQWYLSEGYELNLNHENDQENQQANDQQIELKQSGKQLNELEQSKRYKSQPQISQSSPTSNKYNERCVDDIRPIQISDQVIPYVDNDLNNRTIAVDSNKDDPINTNDQHYSRNSFKRSYRLKKNRPKSTSYVDDVVDESLSMSTSVSPFDEKYNELRDEIFNQSSKTANKTKSNSKAQPTTQSTKSLLDNYNYKKENIEFNEYMDSSSHQLEKSETTVVESNDEFQNKKVTRRSVERIHKNYDDQPMKNILNKPTTTTTYSSSFDRTKSPTKTSEQQSTATTTINTTSRSTYTPLYGKTSLFSNSLFDKPKTTTTTTTSAFNTKPSSSIFDKPTSIFDRPYSDKLITTSRSSYVSPTNTTSKYNTSSFKNQSYSSQTYKNESSSFSKSYSLSPTSKYNTTANSVYDNKQTQVKEPLIERSIIEPKEAQLVHIYDDQEPSSQIKESVYNKKTFAKQPKESNDTRIVQQQNETRPLKTVQANTSSDLPSPRLCTLRLPKDRIASFGFTIKTSRKTNAKIIVDIIRNSIAHRAGLRVNDIIVEVNGVFVGMDTHQQITDRIKAYAEDQVRLLVVTEAEMNIYRNYGLVPSSEQPNVILVEYDSELMMPLHLNDYEDEDCLKGCKGFLDNLTAKQYRNYLQNSKKRPEPANSPKEFQEKIQKFEKL